MKTFQNISKEETENKVMTTDSQKLNPMNSLIYDIALFSKECSAKNYDKYLRNKNNIDLQKEGVPVSKKKLLSNSFVFQGPCQEALTDATTVSQANIIQIYSRKYQQNFIVITVVFVSYLLWLF